MRAEPVSARIPPGASGACYDCASRPFFVPMDMISTSPRRTKAPFNTQAQASPWPC